MGKKLWESVEDALEQIERQAYADADRVAVQARKEKTLSVPVPEWDEYFYVMAQAAALRSKDLSRKVGAVIVSRDNVILSTGFNGFPRGVKDLRERWTDKQEKLLWVAHAEANAIFNAARSGTSVEGGTIYTTTFPCTLCAQAIVQAGLRRVFTNGGYWPRDPLGYEKAAEVLSEPRTIIVDAPHIRAEDNKFRKLVHAMEALDLDAHRFIRSALRKHRAANTNARGRRRPRKHAESTSRPRKAAKKRGAGGGR